MYKMNNFTDKEPNY